MIKLLNHGFIRLIESMGTDLSVVRAARVSYDAAWRAGQNEGSDTKLIKYLWKNKHTSPFEAVTFTFEVKAPIFVFRQWHRHRTFSYSETSGRYCELPEEFYVPEPEHVGVQSKDNKQGRDLSGERLADMLVPGMIKKACEASFEAYRVLLMNSVPRELARSVLPVATYSHMFATVSLLNLFKFITLRSHEHAQYEIRIYSDAMKELVRPIVPVCMEAYENDR